jgi:hypothetical protein
MPEPELVDADRRFHDYFGYPRPRAAADLDAASKKMLRQWRADREQEAEAKRAKILAQQALATKEELDG